MRVVIEAGLYLITEAKINPDIFFLAGVSLWLLLGLDASWPRASVFAKLKTVNFRN